MAVALCGLGRPAGPPSHGTSRLRRYVRDADPVVATNAAIAATREAARKWERRSAFQADKDGLERPSNNRAGTQPPADCLSALTAAVRRGFALPMRAAAVEALASIDGAATLAALRELCDQYGRPGGPQSHYVPELHVELIRGLARHVDAADDPRCTAALRAPSPDVRLEALAAWSESRGKRGQSPFAGTARRVLRTNGDCPLFPRRPLPVELTDLRAAGDYRVRAAALQVMAKHRHPQAEQYAADALRNNDLRMRTAAIVALGQLGGQKPQDALQGLLAKHQPERLRTEAVAALTKMGAKKPVLDAAGDESWRVRAKVAEALPAWPDAEAAVVAPRLLDDPSGEVQARCSRPRTNGRWNWPGRSCCRPWAATAL